MDRGLKKLRDLDISILATMHGVLLSKKNCRNLLTLLDQENRNACESLIEVPSDHRSKAPVLD
jgi:hypothetical protein